MIELQIPSQFNHDNVSYLYNKARAIIEEQTTNGSKKVVNFNFMNLSFIEPDGVVILSNLQRLFKLKKFIIHYTYPKDYPDNPRHYKAVDYLDDSLFFKKNFGKKLHPGSNPRQTTNGIEVLSNSSFNQEYIDKTIGWLKTNLSLRNKSFGELETILTELFNNIIDHSTSMIGGTVFAQHYPNKNHIKLSISDFGMGIANRMKTTYQINFDWEAIELATKPKISTKTTPRNRGMGLDNLLSIIKNNGGTIEILSNWGKVYYNCTQQNNCSFKKQQVEEYFQGTLINIIFRTDTLDIEEEEGFEWSLY